MKELNDYWELPSDAAMIDWIQKGRYRVIPPLNDPTFMWSVAADFGEGTSYVIARGDTWRDAVEKAMYKEYTKRELFRTI